MQRSCVFGYGFLGRHLVDFLLAHDVPVSVFDRKPRPRNLPKEVFWYQGDFHKQRDYSKLLEQVDCLYHLIATTVPSDNNISMVQEIHQNIESTVWLIDACVDAGVSRVVFASSASVYGEQFSLPIKENAPTNPVSVHGIQKLTLEKYLLMAEREGRLEARIARIANPYGKYQNIHGRQGFIAIAIGKMLAGDPMTVRQPERISRDFIHADDIARGLFCLAQSEDALILNIGSGLSWTLAETLAKIGGCLGIEPQLIYQDPVASDITDSCFDIGLLSALGVAPKISFDDGLDQVTKYHLRRYTT